MCINCSVYRRCEWERTLHGTMRRKIEDKHDAWLVNRCQLAFSWTDMADAE